jgi:hypothetical protein
LPDGRKALITPNTIRVADYLVTGEFFEENVRAALVDPWNPDPDRIDVLRGIAVPGGQVPNYFGPDHVHISIGEPLARFAKVKIQGQKGPQAADIERMRALRELLDQAVGEVKNTPRKIFEARFGAPKKGEDPKQYGWFYPLAAGHLQVWFEGEPPAVRTIFHRSGPDPPESQPRDYGKEARAVLQMDRAFLVAFLQSRFRGATAAEKQNLRTYLEKANPVVSWTADERKQLLGEAP